MRLCDWLIKFRILIFDFRVENVEITDLVLRRTFSLIIVTDSNSFNFVHFKHVTYTDESDLS